MTLILICQIIVVAHLIALAALVHLARGSPDAVEYGAANLRFFGGLGNSFKLLRFVYSVKPLSWPVAVATWSCRVLLASFVLAFGALIIGAR